MTSTQINNAMKRTISIDNFIINADPVKVYKIGSGSAVSYYKIMLQNETSYIEIEILGTKIATIKSSNTKKNGDNEYTFNCLLKNISDDDDDTDISDDACELYISGLEGSYSAEVLVTFDSYRLSGISVELDDDLEEYSFGNYYVKVDFVTDSATTDNQTIENLTVNDTLLVNKINLGNWLTFNVDDNELTVTYNIPSQESGNE